MSYSTHNIYCGNIFWQKNVRSFCPAKAPHIFWQKILAFLHMIYSKFYFNVVSFEQPECKFAHFVKMWLIFNT